MEGNIQQIIGYIRNSYKINIPVYQRNYDWNKENCQRLWEDLMMLTEENKKTHFFGSIVVKPADLTFESIVIDGQQRITTISLLLLALHNWMEDSDEKVPQFSPEIIKRNYLITELVSDKEKYKLQSNPRDYNAYKKLFKDEKFHKKTSNLTNNYNFFYEKIKNMSVTPHHLHEVLSRLQIMVVNLNSPDDDPQMIFESLNSTGLELTEGDKIRNFLLMNEQKHIQEDFFSNYWEPIEERVQFEVSDFFFYYLSMKNAKSPKKSRIYNEFSIFYNKNFSNKVEFFEELSDYSLAYQFLLYPDTDSSKINALLNRFNELDTTVVRSFTIQVIRDYIKNDFSEKQVIDILSVLENYIARRMITKLSSNALNKIMSTLSRDVDRLLKNNDNSDPVEVVKFILLSKTNTGKFPTNDEMLNSLTHNDFYNINKRFRTYLFERLENYDHYEALDIYGGIKRQEFSIEHIMPRTLNASWIKELGENYRIIHDRYLHNLGNLTLTGYNSKYSNNSFQDKQNVEKGFKDSHFTYLNKIPASIETWNKNQIENRLKSIQSRALEIWDYPSTTFSPEIMDKEMIIYDGVQNFTNFTIKGYTFTDDTYYEVSTWKDLLVEIVKRLMEIKPEPIERLIKIKEKNGYIKNFSPDKINRSTKVMENFYLKTGVSNYDKMEIINMLFDLYDIRYESLSIDGTLKN